MHHFLYERPYFLCRMGLSNELSGSVNHACGTTLDRSRYCPVLAAWLFAAFARTAFKVFAAAVDAEQAFGAAVVDVTAAEVSGVAAVAAAPGFVVVGFAAEGMVCS